MTAVKQKIERRVVQAASAEVLELKVGRLLAEGFEVSGQVSSASYEYHDEQAGRTERYVVLSQGMVREDQEDKGD